MLCYDWGATSNRGGRENNIQKINKIYFDLHAFLEINKITYLIYFC